MAYIGPLSRAVEDEKPEVAVKMYLDACAMLEEDGREQMAFDTYRAAVNLYIKLHRYSYYCIESVTKNEIFALGSEWCINLRNMHSA